MCRKFGFHCRSHAPPAGNLERPLASSSAPQHASFISSGLRQPAWTHEGDTGECRKSTKVSDERHLQIANAREQNAAANDVVCE